MKKHPLIAVSIVTVVILVLCSFTHIVGYQTVKASNLNQINNRINQKDLLFNTLLDIMNNKEIQKIIINSEINRSGIINYNIRNLFIGPNVLTRRDLNIVYRAGFVLSKTLPKSLIHSILDQYQIINKDIQKQITAIIETDTVLKDEISKLSNYQCDCENDIETNPDYWGICLFLFIIVLGSAALFEITATFTLFFEKFIHTTYFYVLVFGLLSSFFFLGVSGALLLLFGSAWFLVMVFDCLDGLVP